MPINVRSQNKKLAHPRLSARSSSSRRTDGGLKDADPYLGLTMRILTPPHKQALRVCATSSLFEPERWTKGVLAVNMQEPHNQAVLVSPGPKGLGVLSPQGSNVDPKLLLQSSLHKYLAASLRSVVFGQLPRPKTLW